MPRNNHNFAKIQPNGSLLRTLNINEIYNASSILVACGTLFSSPSAPVEMIIVDDLTEEDVEDYRNKIFLGVSDIMVTVRIPDGVDGLLVLSHKFVITYGVGTRPTLFYKVLYKENCGWLPWHVVAPAHSKPEKVFEF